MQMVQDRTLMGRYGNSIMQSNTGPEYFSGYCSQQCILYIVGWENFYPGQMLLRIWENWEKKCKFAKKNTIKKKQWFLSPSFFAKLTTWDPASSHLRSSQLVSPPSEALRGKNIPSMMTWPRQTSRRCVPWQLIRECWPAGQSKDSSNSSVTEKNLSAEYPVLSPPPRSFLSEHSSAVSISSCLHVLHYNF